MVELVDTRDSKSRALKSVSVRVRPLVPKTLLSVTFHTDLKGSIIILDKEIYLGIANNYA